MRFSPAATLFCAAIAFAPAAAAQTSVPLVTTVGDPIPYQIALPQGWNVEQDGDMMTVGTDELMIIVGVMDLMQGEENPLPVSEAETRRIMTNMIMGSDSLLFALLREGISAMREDVELTDVVQAIGTLGGQRSAYMRGRTVDEQPGYFEMHITMKDGIMYMLAFAGLTEQTAANEALFARVRDSLVFAPAPQ